MTFMLISLLWNLFHLFVSFVVVRCHLLFVACRMRSRCMPFLNWIRNSVLRIQCNYQNFPAIGLQRLASTAPKSHVTDEYHITALSIKAMLSANARQVHIYQLTTYCTSVNLLHLIDAICSMIFYWWRCDGERFVVSSLPFGYKHERRPYVQKWLVANSCKRQKCFYCCYVSLQFKHASWNNSYGVPNCK